MLRSRMITRCRGRRNRSFVMSISRSLGPCERNGQGVGAVLDQLDDVEHRLARHRANEREQGPRAETVAAIEDRKTHSHPSSVAASRAPSALSYCRLAWPIAAHTTSSKIWSSLRPDALAAAMSSSVTW